MPFCTFCGTKVDTGKFCTSCGKPLESAPATVGAKSLAAQTGVGEKVKFKRLHCSNRRFLSAKRITLPSMCTQCFLRQQTLKEKWCDEFYRGSVRANTGETWYILQLAFTGCSRSTWHLTTCSCQDLRSGRCYMRGGKPQGAAT